MAFYVGLFFCFASRGTTVSPAPGAMPVAISPPRIYVHCMPGDGKISFVLKWDYQFRFSSENVSGFRIYRRIEEEDYSLVATVNRSEGGENFVVRQEAPDKFAYCYTDKPAEGRGKDYSYKIAAFDATGNEACNEVRIRTDPTADPVAGPANVLVVVNRLCRESVEIGEYYRRRRNIPPENVLYLSYQGNLDTVSVQNFEKKIKLPIRGHLLSHGLKEKILYIVMTYGLPYKVSVSGGRAADSVDAYLTDLFDEYSNDPNLAMAPTAARYRNPYFLAGSHFSRANGNKGYLVARLDGPLASPGDPRYNKETAHRDDPLQYLKNMVDYAIWAEENREGVSGKGYFDRRFKEPWTLPSGLGDLFVNGAYDCCGAVSFKSVLDTNPQLFGTAPADSGGNNPLFCESALWYAGWYSHFYKDVFGWDRGAIGFHIESWTAQNIRTEATYRGQTGWLWVPGMIRAGITATMGPVHEPGLGGVPKIDWFFRYFFHGFSFAEAAYMSSYSSAGQMLMIGDPLYNPFRGRRPDRTPPKISITSPQPGQTVRGTRVLVEGTLDDPNISMLDNARPVRNGGFSYIENIASSRGNRARLPVIVCATDASGNTTTASVTVNWVNTPPSLEPIQPMEIHEGETLAFSLKGSDADSDRLFYHFALGSAQPLGASLNRRTGQFKWKPGFDQAGTYEFAFDASDGPASDTKRFTLTVRQAGSHPPKFLSVPRKVTRKAGEAVYVELKAEDLDGDNLSFSAETALPDGAAIIQSPPNHAAFLWKPAPDQVGSHKIVVIVTDEKHGQDTMSLEIEIAPAFPPQSP